MSTVNASMIVIGAGSPYGTACHHWQEMVTRWSSGATT